MVDSDLLGIIVTLAVVLFSACLVCFIFHIRSICENRLNRRQRRRENQIRRAVNTSSQMRRNNHNHNNDDHPLVTAAVPIPHHPHSISDSADILEQGIHLAMEMEQSSPNNHINHSQHSSSDDMDNHHHNFSPIVNFTSEELIMQRKLYEEIQRRRHQAVPPLPSSSSSSVGILNGRRRRGGVRYDQMNDEDNEEMTMGFHRDFTQQFQGRLKRYSDDQTAKDINEVSKKSDVHSDAASVAVDTGVSLNRVCAVCLDDFETGELLAVLPCEHQFHESCILDWLREDTSQHTCPICREQVPIKHS